MPCFRDVDALSEAYEEIGAEDFGGAWGYRPWGC